jgi:diguanylate cyclase (GGDEF)-like protein
MRHKREIVKKKEKELEEIEIIASQMGTWSHEEVVGALKDFATEIVKELAEVREMSITHEMTGLVNRRFSTFFLKREFKTVKRYGKKRRLSVVLIDLDELKFINDNYSHLDGDLAITKLANVIKSQIRGDDVACHWGGDEFLIVCPGVGAQQARELAERIRRMIKNTKIKNEKELSISAGVTDMAKKDKSINELLGRADKALYQAKEEGGGRVIISN